MNKKIISEDVNETSHNNEDKLGAAMSDAAQRIGADDILNKTTTE